MQHFEQSHRERLGINFCWFISKLCLGFSRPVRAWIDADIIIDFPRKTGEHIIAEKAFYAAQQQIFRYLEKCEQAVSRRTGDVADGCKDKDNVQYKAEQVRKIGHYLESSFPRPASSRLPC